MDKVFIKVCDISKLKFGIATYSLKILSMYPYRVNWGRLSIALKNKRLFNSFDSYSEYLKYVLNLSTYGPKINQVTSEVSQIYKDTERLKPFKEYLVSMEELNLIFSIYDIIIYNCIKNVRKKKNMFDFDIDIYIEEIEEFYIKKNKVDCVESFMKALECFMQYNMFLFMGYEADFYLNKEIITIKFYEDET